MFPNWSGWKTVKAILAVAGAVLPTVIPAADVPLEAAILSGVIGVVVVLSGTSFGPALVKKS